MAAAAAFKIVEGLLAASDVLKAATEWVGLEFGVQQDQLRDLISGAFACAPSFLQ